MQGAARFVQRIWRLVNDGRAVSCRRPGQIAKRRRCRGQGAARAGAPDAGRRVDDGIERLRFNTAIAKLYTFVGALAGDC